MRKSLHWLHECFSLFLALSMLGGACLAWSILALALGFVLPEKARKPVGRSGISIGFRVYLWLLRRCCACHFDLTELDKLRGAGPLIIAPNHPSLLDAFMVLSRLPGVACVTKARLLDNLFLGAGARLAGFIRNDQFIGMVKHAIAELAQGQQLLLFPEGTRSAADSLAGFKGSVSVIACRAQVPVQLVLIECDSHFLGKGWPLLRRPRLPVHFRIRLGSRLEPGHDPAAFSAELQSRFREECGKAEASFPTNSVVGKLKELVS